MRNLIPRNAIVVLVCVGSLGLSLPVSMAQDAAKPVSGNASMSSADLPNPAELAPMIAKSWAENLVAARRSSWIETATIEADDFVQLTHVTSNHFGRDGSLVRKITENTLHYQRKAGMKKRIRRNLELDGSSWIEKLSGLVAAYAYPGSKQMEDWIARSNMVIAGKEPWRGNWEITTRRTVAENDRLTQWVEPETYRFLARNFETVFEGKEVRGELHFQEIDTTMVLQSAQLDFPGSKTSVHFEYGDYVIP